MRTFAILNIGNNVNLEENLMKWISQDDKIIVFSHNIEEEQDNPRVSYVKIPEELKFHESRIRNFMLETFMERQDRGFLHIISDSVRILKDPGTFLAEIEKMMKNLNLNSWFNTITDGCNYTFKRYNPRFFVDIDDTECKNIYDKRIFWTSHANTSWVCYDMDNATFEEIALEEKFDIAMYYIIKFLANRRNFKKPGELHYMNMYPTIAEEVGVFETIPVESDYPTHSKEDFDREGKIFAEMDINHEADMDIAAIIQDMINVLKGKSVQ